MTLATTDAELVAAYRNSGDPTAIDELVRRHVGRVRWMIFAMLQDDAAADDVTQEVFVRALRALPKFRGEAEFATWLYRIAMNCVHSHRTRESRQQGLITSDGATAAVATFATADAPAIGRELAAAVENALGQLTPKLRAAVVLISINGLDARQAATVEGCTASTMHWRLHAARKQLKRLLNGYL